MTFQEIQCIKDVGRLRSLKQEFILKADKYKKKAHSSSKAAHKYCSLSDVVDRLHWRIKEIIDEE
jgi:hypothetical protein